MCTASSAQLLFFLGVKQYAAGRLLTFSSDNATLNCGSTIRSIEVASFTKTSSSSGNVDNGWSSEVMVVGAWCTSEMDAVVIPYSNNGKTWWFHCMSDGSSHTPVANKSLTIKVALFYLNF